MSASLFDQALLRSRRARAWKQGSLSHALFETACNRMGERLDEVQRDFTAILELGSRDGRFTKQLSKRWKKATCVQAELAPNWKPKPIGENVSPLVIEEERLCFAPESFDLVVSLLHLHFRNDIPGLLAQIRKILRPDGLFLAVFVGGDSLLELRQSLLQAEAEVLNQASVRVSPFLDLVTATRLLQRAGFALPLGDVDRLRWKAPDPWSLMLQLHEAGASNAVSSRAKGLTPPRLLQRCAELYQEQFPVQKGGVAGQVFVSFDLLFLTAWVPAPSQPKALLPGSGKVRLAEALQTTEHKTQN